jgi:hypothetical protein
MLYTVRKKADPFGQLISMMQKKANTAYPFANQYRQHWEGSLEAMLNKGWGFRPQGLLNSRTAVM